VVGHTARALCPPRIGTEGSGVFEKKILLPLPGFETRIYQNVAYTLQRLIHPSRLPSFGRAAKTTGVHMPMYFNGTNFGKTSKASVLGSGAKQRAYCLEAK
jgi:hypothetical protein